MPEEVVAILHRMMARKPADRYQTPTEILEDIENLGAGNKRMEEVLGADADENFPSAGRGIRRAHAGRAAAVASAAATPHAA